MSFSYDVTRLADTDRLRLLLGDTVAQSANFQDEELTGILQMTSDQMPGNSSFFGSGTVPSRDVLFLSAATALDSLASRVASSSNGQSIQIGDFKLTGKDQVGELRELAQRYRDAVDEFPAWGVVQENLSGFNELLLLRNWVLRTEF